MAHPNEELLRRAYAAFSAGDLDTVFASFDEDIRWHVPGRGALSGDYRGHAEVMEFFGRILELSGGTFTVEPHDVLGNDEHVVVLVRLQGERDGKMLNTQDVHVWHVANGKATEFWEAPTDQYGTDEFWS
jgi:uncharacterized protein